MKTIRDYNSVVPENIKRIIKEKCYKQGLISKRAGYEEQQLTDMLNGRKIIKPCDVFAIADALEVNPEDLFRRGE